MRRVAFSKRLGTVISTAALGALMALVFSDFSGKLIVTGTSGLAATAILMAPTGSVMVPVAEIP